MNKKDQRYMIVATCDPYNARHHYHGERVLQYDGATPVVWVADDDYDYGYSLEEAKNALDDYTRYFSDDASYIDEEWLSELVEAAKEDGIEDLDTSWYEGEGWYENNRRIYHHDAMSLRADVMRYYIAEYTN